MPPSTEFLKYQHWSAKPSVYKLLGDIDHFKTHTLLKALEDNKHFIVGHCNRHRGCCQSCLNLFIWRGGNNNPSRTKRKKKNLFYWKISRKSKYFGKQNYFGFMISFRQSYFFLTSYTNVHVCGKEKQGGITASLGFLHILEPLNVYCHWNAKF